MIFPSSVDILIAGAGSSDLTPASDLARRNKRKCPF
jgi:ribulose 1,5-bisphosphate synthetase/thiazole synthase